MRQGILEPLQPGGVTNASPVVWQRKKKGAMRRPESQLNGNVIEEVYPTPDLRPHSIISMGSLTLAKLTSDAYYQIEFDEDAKEIRKFNSSQGLFKLCRLP